MRIIAFCGPKMSGKDTAAEGLFKQNKGDTGFYFRKASFAAGVKGICLDFFHWSFDQMDDGEFKETPIPYWPGGPVMEPRWAMMDIANFLRDKYGPDVHAQRWEADCILHDRVGTAHVCTDLRFPNELEYMRKHDALVIYIERPGAEEKLANAQATGDSMALNPSEQHYAILRAYAEQHGVVIHNDEGIPHLQGKVQACVTNRLGHWTYWEAKDREDTISE